jgi:hypothetical protein
MHAKEVGFKFFISTSYLIYRARVQLLQPFKAPLDNIKKAMMFVHKAYLYILYNSETKQRL